MLMFELFEVIGLFALAAYVAINEFHYKPMLEEKLEKLRRELDDIKNVYNIY